MEYQDFRRLLAGGKVTHLQVFFVVPIVSLCVALNTEQAIMKMSGIARKGFKAGLEKWGIGGGRRCGLRPTFRFFYVMSQAF